MMYRVFFATIALAVSLAATAAEPVRSANLGPVVKTYRGEKCVEPTDDMRRNHMKYILHQRDRTMHQGIRTSRHSLKNCVNCHADPISNSVLGQDGFCASCHHYASVKIDCFTCHTDKGDKNAMANLPALRSHTQRTAP